MTLRVWQSVFSVLLLVVAAVVTWVLRDRWARETMADWARANGYEVISAEPLLLWAGPFTMRRRKGQAVFRIHVRDEAGVERRGWVRCGGLLLGVVSKAVAVEWDSAR